jgi:PTS system ascorbate-specific IIB component
VKIVAICGAGVGSSGILKVNTERVLDKLGLEADVTAADLRSISVAGANAQIILTSAEFVEAIGKTNADVIVIENYFDLEELTNKLDAALG